MSWQSMALEISTSTPTPFPLALTLVNRAWSQVQREFLFSFLWADCAIPTPQWDSTGFVLTTLGSDQVVGDAAASASWATYGLVIPITTRQFRVGQGTIYSIIAADFSTPTAAVLTLDKPFVDPTAGVGGYTIFKCYYTLPFQDAIWFESVTDPVTGYDLNVCLTREEVDAIDPQRLNDGWPIGILPRGVISTPGAFQNFPSCEIWPAPNAGYTYVASVFRAGAPFVNSTDTVSYPLGEDVVLAMAKVYAYEYCASNPDKVQPEARKADWRYLIGAAAAQYKILLNGYIMRDEGFSKRHIVKFPSSSYITALPWISARLMLGRFN